VKLVKRNGKWVLIKNTEKNSDTALSETPNPARNARIISSGVQKTAQTAQPNIYPGKRSLKNSQQFCKKVTSKDGRQVEVCAEVINYEKRVENDSIIEYPNLKYLLKYKDKTLECIKDCEGALDEISKLTYRHPSKSEIINAMDELTKSLTRVTPLKEFVNTDDKARGIYEVLKRDPIQTILRLTEEVKGIKGNEKVKLATLLSIASTRIKRGVRDMIYRFNFIVVGKYGAGKSSSVKSVLGLFFDHKEYNKSKFLLFGRITEKALGYFKDINDYDGALIYVEQIDNISEISYLREALSEAFLSTLVTTRDENTGELRADIVSIKGQPAFISTNVDESISSQLASRMFQLYLEPSVDRKEIMESKADENKASDEELFAIRVATWLWYSELPADARVPKDLWKRVVDTLERIGGNNVLRTSDLVLALLKSLAIIHGRDVVTEEDVNITFKYFSKEIILATYGISEREIKALEVLTSTAPGSPMTTFDIAIKLDLDKNTTASILEKLNENMLVGKEFDGKKRYWWITDKGRDVLERLKTEVKIVGDVVEVKTPDGEVIADKEFFREPDSRDDTKNAVSGGREGVREGESYIDRRIKAILRREFLGIPIRRLRFRGEKLDRFAGLSSYVLTRKDIQTIKELDRVKCLRKSEFVSRFGEDSLERLESFYLVRRDFNDFISEEEDICIAE